MSLFDRMATTIGVYPFTPSTYDSAFDESVAHRPLATHLSTSRAEGVPIVYICTRVVSEDIAKVSLHIYEDMGVNEEGRSLGKRKAVDHEWYDTLHHEANTEQTAIDFREMMTAFALNRGRGIAEKRKRRVGGTVVRELVPLHPDLVAADYSEGGSLRWLYNDPITHRQRRLLPDEVLVLWGPRRRSVISFLREMLAVQLAGQDYRGQQMKRGPRHTGVIMRPREAPKWTDTARENFRKAVDEYMGEGERAGRPMFLEDGMTWANAGFSMVDSEFLATAMLDNALVCGAYRVPQHKAGLLERSTNNNIQQQATDYVVDCLLAWAVRWEQALRMSLLDDPFKAEHNLRTLLRGDPKTAAETHAIYWSIAAETGNEIRDDEGRNPMDGLDEVRVPMNVDVPGLANANADGHRRALVRHQAARVVRKELQTLSKIAERHNGAGAEWEAEVRAFYREHADFAAKELRITDEQAAAYVAARCQGVLEGGVFVEDMEDSTVGDLVAYALADGAGQAAPLTMAPPRTVIHNHPPPSPPAPNLVLSEGMVRVDVAPAQVSAPVTITKGAIQVDSPVTIEKGAVAAAPVTVNMPARGPMTRIPQRDEQGRITAVREVPDGQ